MKSLIALALLLAGCVAPPASVTPTEAPTAQPTSVAVEETQVPTEVPPPTEAPTAASDSPSSDLEPTEILFRVYMFHASFGESIAEMAQSPDDRMGMFVVTNMMTGIDEAFLLDWPDELAADVAIAQQQQNALKDILIKWGAEEIAAEQVPDLLTAVGIQPNTLAFIEKLRAQGMTDEDLKAMVERHLAAIDESMPE